MGKHARFAKAVQDLHRIRTSAPKARYNVEGSNTIVVLTIGKEQFKAEFQPDEADELALELIRKADATRVLRDWYDEEMPKWDKPTKRKKGKK